MSRDDHPGCRLATEAALAHLLLPLSPWLDDDSITEILINGPGAAWVEQAGRLQPVAVCPGQSQLRAIARLVASASQVETLEQDATLEGNWRDWRVTVVLPPVAADGVCLALRRHRRHALPLADWGTPDGEVLAQLRAALERHDNILVAGATGSGKTTLLAGLLAEIDARERLVCLEDTPELPRLGAHQVLLRTRHGHDLRSLLRLALRLRPDRLVVGEVRGAEAFDLLQAMATGHRGCLGTLHAADPRGALARLEQLILTCGLDWPLPAVRAQIAASVQLLVQVARTPRGRAVTDIVRLSGVADAEYRMLSCIGKVAAPQARPAAVPVPVQSSHRNPSG
ncbi:MAG: CpaF family protein [Pseudomonadota bacterium]|nr:CpaF family protein [Pseudomonadota bacterium]